MLELIQSDYYEETGKTNFAKDLREEHNEDLDWICESRYRYGGIGGVGVGGIGGVGVGVGGIVGGGDVVGFGGFGGVGRGIGGVGDMKYDI
jgi:hypothetical protein